VHSLPTDDNGEKNDDDSENDTILASIPLDRLEISEAEDEKKKKQKTAACRATIFSQKGDHLYAGVGVELCGLDAERACSLGMTDEKETVLWRLPQSKAPIQCLRQLPASAPCGPLLCVGDDNGGIRLWDTRMCGSHNSIMSGKTSGKKNGACVLSWEDNEDYISGFEFNADGTTLLASSADCTMSIIDIRKAANPQTRAESFRQSDNQEDELLSVQILKHGKKVVCGTQQGVLAVWSWGIWGDVSDRFPGHPASIDTLLKVDEDTVLTGSSDGLIRLVQLHPDKLLGVLGEHDGYPVEKLQFNADRSFVGSVSHDNLIRLWDASILKDDADGDDKDEEEEEDEEEDRKISSVGSSAAAVASKPKHGSDDDWSDEDDMEDDKDSDDDDDDDSDDEEQTTNDRRSKRFKSENERFFEDL
jgi:WD40 repeat protein